MPIFYESKSIKKERINQDKKTNEFGYELRDLCVSANLKILNGRTIGDLLGKYTYVGPKGCSTVDYIIASDNILSGKNETVKTFHVLVENINRLSDHCCTSVYLQKGEGWVKEETLVTEIDASSVREKKLLFNQQYENLINSAEVRETARKVLCNINTNLGKESIDTVTQKVVDIIINVNKSCEVIGGGKERFKRKHKKRNNREPWFNLDCRKLKSKE